MRGQPSQVPSSCMLSFARKATCMFPSTTPVVYLVLAMSSTVSLSDRMLRPHTSYSATWEGRITGHKGISSADDCPDRPSCLRGLGRHQGQCWKETPVPLVDHQTGPKTPDSKLVVPSTRSDEGQVLVSYSLTSVCTVVHTYLS